MLASSGWSQQVQPRVLIVETKSDTTAGDSMDISMASFVAQELLTEGRVMPVVYSMTDPIFRGAVEEGKLVTPPKWPSLSQAIQVARRLDARYVLSFHPGVFKNGAERERAELYDRGRKVWSDEQNMGVKQGDDISTRATSQSIARTWVLHLETDKGPFKSLVVTHPLETPTDRVGQEPIAPIPSATLPSAGNDDDSGLKGQIDKLLLDHQTDRAILLLRDAVDQKPFDAERRILLVQTLLDANHSAEAGEEADRAVLIAPDHTELRALAAKAWMAAGKNDEARTSLNDALAHNGNAVRTRLMLAEISIARLEPDKALEHLDAAIKAKPSREAYYLRALCRALLGGQDGVQADITAASNLHEAEMPSDVERRYELSATTIDDALKSMGDDARLYLQRATVRAADSALHDQVSEALRLLNARITYLSSAPVPPTYHRSNERRLLAERVLVQSMLALQSFFNGGGDDAMTDARIDLGEALKQAAGARAAFAEERAATATKGSG